MVAIPTVGDPDPICLNPPDPLGGSAELIVSLEMTPGASTQPSIQVSAGTQTCQNAGSSCSLRGLPVGEPVDVLAVGTDGCEPAMRTMVLGAGPTA